ncbi:MAG: ABC transporter substrate-binding protein [Thermoanaerobaculia bacterium]|nr:ABC transporter substrate-binding protein [Thermoanaerobaculia bacterium]
MKFCPVCGKEYETGDLCTADVCAAEGVVLIQPQPSQADLLIGRVLGDSYRIEEKIGEGGMGTVFRGVQIALQRDVAIKVILPGLQSTPSMIQRFYREARLLSQLNHPNVVSIIDFGHTADGLVFMVMELLVGATLDDLVESNEGLDVPRIVALVRQICSGVSAAHRRGLVHRDLKPDNVFVVSGSTATEQVKLLDFGIARAMEVEGQTRLTQAGHLIGTPGFLAPEQIQGEDADIRTDVYALGALLYYMVVGQRPYAGTTPQAIFARQLRELPKFEPAALGDRLPLATVFEQAMRIDPAERFQSAEEMAGFLETTALDAGLIDTDTSRLPTGVTIPARQMQTPTTLLRDEVPQPARRRRWIPIVALVVLTLAAIAVLWLRPWQTGGEDSTAGGAARGVSDDSVLLGMSAAFSGPARELGRAMQLGIETCLRDAEAGGGIHGRKLELIALDDGYEPSRTVANMAKLALEREVFAVLGNVGTPTAEVAVPFALEQRLPFFGAFSGADLLRKDPPDRFVFNYRASYAEETAAIVDYFLDVRWIRADEIAVFAQQDSFGDAGYRGVEAELTQRDHREPTLRLGYRRNTNDVEEAVERLLRHDTDIRAVVLVATYRAAAEFIRRIEDAGLAEDRDMLYASLSFVGSRAFAEELQNLGGHYADGVIVTQVVPHFESDLPAVASYRRLLAEHYPAEQPGFVSLEGYLAARIFVEGLQRAGPDLSIDGFVAAVESIRGLDLGIGEPIHYGPDRHQGSRAVWGTVLDAEGQYRMLDLAGRR